MYDTHTWVWAGSLRWDLNPRGHHLVDRLFSEYADRVLAGDDTSCSSFFDMGGSFLGSNRVFSGGFHFIDCR